jgi:hypothetical protein
VGPGQIKIYRHHKKRRIERLRLVFSILTAPSGAGDVTFSDSNRSWISERLEESGSNQAGGAENGSIIRQKFPLSPFCQLIPPQPH